MTKRNLFVSGSDYSSNKKVRNDLNQIVLEHREEKVIGTDKPKSYNDKKSEACVPSSTSPSLYFQAPNMRRGVQNVSPIPNEIPKEKPCKPDKVNYCT